MPKKQKRKRGVLLTPEGLQKLQSSKLALELNDNYGNKYTLEDLSDRVGVNTATISKVLSREEGVDKLTLELFFKAFNLELDKTYYVSSDQSQHQDWGKAICVSVFYGRQEELATLEQWVLRENCRVVALLGMGGIGKTALAIKLAEQIKDNFEYIIWRSLREAPSVKALLANLIQFLSDNQETETTLPENVGDRILRLISYLREHRCLLILDNLESIMRDGSRAGIYREGYEGYGELIKLVGEATHQSCLVLTSREKPKEVASQQGKSLSVRSLLLNGLKPEDGQEILKMKGISVSESQLSRTLVERYGGNVLALKIVATTIQDLFNGSISEFLQQETVVFGDICDLLDQQFSRLLELEKEIMYWLAINLEPVSISELREDIHSSIPQVKLLEALESLRRRSLIEQNALLFMLQPVVMEYITQRLIEQVNEEIVTQDLQLFRSHALMKATAKDYIINTQRQVIIQPLINKLLTHYRNKKSLETQFIQILARLQETSSLEQSYTAGNILNLLCSLETDLTGYDFSNLTIWQADMRYVNLHNTNFTHANLAKCVFAATIGGIHSVAFNPNGKILAMGDTNGDISLYQVTDGRQLLTIRGHTGFVWPITFSPDGYVIASGSADQTVKLWDANSGQCLANLQDHSGGIWSVAFHPHSTMLASGSEDQTVKLWDPTSGQLLKTLHGHSNRVTSVAFNSQGTILVSGSDDQKVRLWDLKTYQCLKTLEYQDSEVRSVAFSPDGQTLAIGYCDQTIKLLNPVTYQCIQTLQGHQDCVNSVAFSYDSQTLASGSDDQTVKLWDVTTGQCLTTLYGHSSRISSVAFRPYTYTLASGSEDQTVKLWDVTTGLCLKTFQGYCNGVWSVAFSPNNNYIASGNNDQTVKLWDVRAERCLKILQGHSNRVTSVAFNSQNTILASGSEDQTVKLWDINTGQCFKTLQGHTNRITSIAFSRNGDLLASGSQDQTVKLWDVKTTQCVKTLEKHTHWVWTVAFNPNGNLLASGSNDQKIRLWDVSTGLCLQTLDGHTDWIWSLIFSPNGCTLASASSDQTIKLWDVSTGRHLKTLEGHGSSVHSVAFLDAHILASGSGDHTVKLWDISAGKCIRTLIGHSKFVWSVTFSPDGQTLASSSEDETIKLWNFKTGECQKTLKSSKSYEGMNINGVTGVSPVTIATMKALGAVEY
ncbi:NB-ARC domain-containing protein [Nostoc sp. UHCC 0252]|uniref:WD40 domain-containing protein n=1 Tax=Nostoc sp. UHCC 0252 TaxID=3110241 RepID=UPI002B2129DE|nr:NB-ARC domain-containing protein [Nostoc sp. UHCC 0252]MEA5601610.1 NB-ARC domain-containing protein [Nostoc sp. UHCC 0252]